VGGLEAGADSVSHIIQTALTPVFFLSGIGALLNVFNQRLVRVSDQVSHITELLENGGDAHAKRNLRHLLRLRRRRVALDFAVGFLALAGAATCGAAFALFVVTLRDASSSALLLWLFGAALGFTMAALAAFLVDTVLAWHGIRMDGPMPHTKG
jgi:hypothetical protein